MGHQGVEEEMVGMSADCVGWIIRRFMHISVNQKAERDKKKGIQMRGGVLVLFLFKSKSHTHGIMASISRTQF